MRTFESTALASMRRSHPWSTTTNAPTQQYVDFRQQPELIPTTLEDFIPWAHYAAVEDFYRLVAAVNGSASTLESNDCEFTGPEKNTEPSIPFRLQCSGRIGLMLRDLSRNTEPRVVRRWIRGMHQTLAALEPDFLAGAIGTSLLDVDYLALEKSGVQVIVSFWAWGNTEGDCFANLSRVVAALASACDVPTR